MGLVLRGFSMDQLFLKCFFEVDERECVRINLAHTGFPKHERDTNAMLVLFEI